MQKVQIIKSNKKRVVIKRIYRHIYQFTRRIIVTEQDIYKRTRRVDPLMAWAYLAAEIRTLNKDFRSSFIQSICTLDLCQYVLYLGVERKYQILSVV